MLNQPFLEFVLNKDTTQVVNLIILQRKIKYGTSISRRRSNNH
jgi:hypothetical protein